MTEKVDPNPIVSPVLPDFHAKYLTEKDLRVYYQDLVYGLCSLFDESEKVCQIGELKGKVAELLKKNGPKCPENDEKEAEIKKLHGELAYWKHAATEIAIQRDNAIHGTACDIVDMIESEFDIDLKECNCQSCIDTKCTQEHLAKLVRDRYCPEIEYNLDTDSEPLDLDTLAMIEKF